MHYSDHSVVAIFGDAPTRVHRNGSRVAFQRPKAQASNHPRIFRFVAISQDPFACVFRTHAPLAERHCPAYPLAGFNWHYPIHP